MSDFSVVRDFFQPGKRYLVVVHRAPDFDAVGSALGLIHQLDRLGIDTVFWVDEKIPEQFRFLPGIDRIHSRYPSGEFDALVALDCSNIERVSDYENVAKAFAGKPILNIDHHGDNSQFGTVNVVEDISSVSEMIVGVSEQLDWPIGQDIATCLYAGMVFDTGQFRFSNVSPVTLRRAAVLIEAGAPFVEISQRIFEDKPPEYFEVVRSALKYLFVDSDLRYAYTSIHQDPHNVGYEVINFIRTLKDVDVFVVFRQMLRGEVKVNFRSKSDFDVAAFAAQFGGGGHAKAAGLVLEGEISEVERAVILKLRDALAG